MGRFRLPYPLSTRPGKAEVYLNQTVVSRETHKGSGNVLVPDTRLLLSSSSTSTPGPLWSYPTDLSCVPGPPLPSSAPGLSSSPTLVLPLHDQNWRVKTEDEGPLPSHLRSVAEDEHLRNRRKETWKGWSGPIRLLPGTLDRPHSTPVHNPT